MENSGSRILRLCKGEKQHWPPLEKHETKDSPILADAYPPALKTKLNALLDSSQKKKYIYIFLSESLKIQKREGRGGQIVFETIPHL